MACALALSFGWFALRERRRRRGAERLAAELGRQLRAVSGAMHESVIAYDLNFRVLFVTPAFEALTGFPAANLRGRDFVDYIHPDDRTAVLAEWESVKAGGSMLGQEYRIVTRDGRVRWVAGTWEPLRDELGRQVGLLGAEQDITERKRAEEELRHESELFLGLVEVQRAASAAALDGDAVLRVVTERSQALTQATGAAVELIAGDGLTTRVQVGAQPPRTEPRTSLAWLAVRTGEPQRCDDALLDLRIDRQAFVSAGVRSLLTVPLVQGTQPIGALTVVSSEPHAFHDRDTRVLRLLAGMIGVTLSHASAVDQRQTRLEERTRALQESETRFKQLVDAAQEGIWVLDDRGVTTYVNNRLATLLGYESGEMLGRPLRDFADPASRKDAERRLGRDGAARAAVSDLRFHRKDGSEVWTIVATSPILGRDGARVGTVAMLTDITERKRAEDRLRRSADRLRLLHEIDQAVVAAKSLREVGRAALGRLRRMIPCHRCSAVLYDFEANEASLFAGFEGADELAAAPISLTDLSPLETLRLGTVRSVEDLGAMERRPPLLDRLYREGIRSVLSIPLIADGEVIGELNLGSQTAGGFEPEHRDIAQEVALPLAIAVQHARLRTTLRQQSTELERRLAARAAELQATVAELESVTHAIAHDLRAPLRQLLGFTQQILEQEAARLTAGGRRAAERALDSARTLGDLMDALLQLSRIGRQDLLRRPTDLNALVEDVRRDLEPALERRDVRWQIGDLPTVTGDPSLLELAVRHLIGNAVKFTRVRAQATIRVFCANGEDQLGLGVADNGVGFDPAQAGRLFAPFHRLHHADEFEGLGIGLAVVQRIAARHGGRAWAEGTAGQGATFYFTVPGFDAMTS